MNRGPGNQTLAAHPKLRVLDAAPQFRSGTSTGKGTIHGQKALAIGKQARTRDSEGWSGFPGQHCFLIFFCIVEAATILGSKRGRTLSIIVLLCALGGWLACQGTVSTGGAPKTRLQDKSIKVVQQYPHDPQAFTQGLLWYKGFLYESTGRYGLSDVRKSELETGRLVQRTALPFQFFGEGLALVEDRLIQLTWMEQTAFTYSLTTLREESRIPYTGEGWGLCYDGNWLIMSDGTDKLTFRDPQSLALWRTVRVTLGGRPLSRLNELEFANGRIYANVWQQDFFVEIDPASGVVGARIDASGIPYQVRRPGEDVLNGIAFRPETGTFLLTGKLWPTVYEVEIVPDESR